MKTKARTVASDTKDFIEQVKGKPLLSLGSVAILAGACWWAYGFVTTTFVLAADYNRQQVEHQREYGSQFQQQAVQINSTTKLILEQEIYRLQSGGVKSAQDQARLAQLLRQRDDIVRASAEKRAYQP